MRKTIPLANNWRYFPAFDESYIAAASLPEGARLVDLPHANLELPYNAFDEGSYQFVSSYERELDIPLLLGGQRAFLDFEAVMTACDLWINGVHAGGHLGGYTPFSVEITDLVRAGKNRLLLRVDSTERKDIPPFGHVIDYLCYGGVYRGVFLRVQEASFIRDLFAMPRVADSSPLSSAAKSLDVEVTIDTRAASQAAASQSDGLFARLLLREAGGEAILAETRAPFGSGARVSLSLSSLEACKLWDIDAPALYEVEVILEGSRGELDAQRRRVGFRRAEWRPEGFFLNGRRVRIRGLNRHQAWPYAGYAMPARAQRRDAEILKRELGLNLVRTSHYPQAKAFLDACDELGLLVFEELPGWQHIGDSAWKDNACAALEEMIVRDRSRPSIVLWGARINESKDDHDFYARTNEIAHRLDPTRATGGVRYIEKSELLEDVYTMNDFNHNGVTVPLRKPAKVTGLRKGVPYVVTEHNGHMYPTKRFDNEERLSEHALRHARVLNASHGMPGISGAIGWCAFDYNTHKDFGSGDRICYHGVSDMFRIPKYAAALYASQAEAEAGVVLETASLFAKGERSAAHVLPIEIYTNCDEVLLFHGGKEIGRFEPDRESFPHLPHPPIVVKDLVGDQLEGSRFSRRDQAILKRVVGKIFSIGFENLSLRDKLAIALLLLRNRMSMQEGEELVGGFILGWGQEDQSWEVVGLIGGKEVLRRRYGGDAVPAKLEMRADDSELSLEAPAAAGEAWDCTRVVLRLVDQYGNLSPFATESVQVLVEGPGRVIGPTTLPLVGGCLAFWVRTTGQAGEIRVRAKGTRFEAEPLGIRVE